MLTPETKEATTLDNIKPLLLESVLTILLQPLIKPQDNFQTVGRDQHDSL